MATLWSEAAGGEERCYLGKPGTRAAARWGLPAHENYKLRLDFKTAQEFCSIDTRSHNLLFAICFFVVVVVYPNLKLERPPHQLASF